jgi:hypothetical protein
VSQWEKWGVRPAYGKLPNGAMEASLILPMGRHGPAFLAYPNFQAFLGWNSAYVYSTTVAYFATRLNGAPAVDHEGAKQIQPLTTEQVTELQKLLNKQGYDVGEPDAERRSATFNSSTPAGHARRRFHVLRTAAMIARQCIMELHP